MGITSVLKGVQKFKENKFEVRSVDFVNLFVKFLKFLKIRGYPWRIEQPKQQP